MKTATPTSSLPGPCGPIQKYTAASAHSSVAVMPGPNPPSHPLATTAGNSIVNARSGPQSGSRARRSATTTAVEPRATPYRASAEVPGARPGSSLRAKDAVRTDERRLSKGRPRRKRDYPAGTGGSAIETVYGCGRLLEPTALAAGRDHAEPSSRGSVASR